MPRIYASLSDEEKRRLQELAKLEGIPLSHLVSKALATAPAPAPAPATAPEQPQPSGDPQTVCEECGSVIDSSKIALHYRTLHPGTLRPKEPHKEGVAKTHPPTPAWKSEEEFVNELKQFHPGRPKGDDEVTATAEVIRDFLRKKGIIGK